MLNVIGNNWIKDYDKYQSKTDKMKMGYFFCGETKKIMI